MEELGGMGEREKQSKRPGMLLHSVQDDSGVWTKHPSMHFTPTTNDSKGGSQERLIADFCSATAVVSAH